MLKRRFEYANVNHSGKFSCWICGAKENKAHKKDCVFYYLKDLKMKDPRLCKECNSVCCGCQNEIS